MKDLRKASGEANAIKTDSPARVPGLLAAFDNVTRHLLGAGVPVGPFALLTVRGRRSGVARTTTVSVVQADGRRWVQCTTGVTEWARNLRASGVATLTVGRRSDSVKARELSRDEAAAFFRDVLGPRVRKVLFGTWLIGSVLGSRAILEDPRAAAELHPVFELTPIDTAPETCRQRAAHRM
jgi:deazaflavin-dependent oxidoreductase (nitroreductase family)